MRRRLVCFAAALTLLFLTAWQAAEAKVNVEVFADRTEPIYRCGETVTFTIKVSENDKPVTKGDVEIVLSLDGGRTISEETVALRDKPATVSGTLQEPGFLLCTATMQINDEKRTGLVAAPFEPERIKTAATLPDDFDEFWAEGRARVDAIPMDLKLEPLPEYTDEHQESFKISMANIDNTRIYGYLSVPKGQEPPYPAFVMVPGASVGVPNRATTEQAAAGALALHMGVHTHDLGLPNEEYQKLWEGPLRDYQLLGAPDREEYFFRRAILGIDRAVRYLISRPDWDHKRMMYFGSSQGGGMGLILAGLNPEISHVALNVPALCDHNGNRLGRTPGWPQLVLHAPEGERDNYGNMAEYFDAVNFARRIRCPVIMSVGFMDRTCPPSSVYSAYNVLQGPKRIFHGPRSGHRFPPSFLAFFDPWMDSHLGRLDPIAPMTEEEAAQQTGSNEATGERHMKVLIIGNSQITSNDLPRMIETLPGVAPEDVPRIEIGRGIVDGASLKKCWDKGTGDGTPRGMIASQQWDYVVIQEIFCANKPEFEEYAAKFDDAIKKAGSKTMLFATANVTEYYQAPYRYPDSFKTLNDMQIAFGKKRDIPVAAAGYAWMKYLGPTPSEAQTLDLYAEDKGHPGFKGSYIYACLLYAHITGYNPESLPLPDKGIDYGNGKIITRQEAAKMRSVAWEQYRESTSGTSRAL